MTSGKGVRGCLGDAKADTFETLFGAGRVYTATCQPRLVQHAGTRGRERTLWEEAAVSINQMLAKVPPVSELVVALE